MKAWQGLLEASENLWHSWFPFFLLGIKPKIDGFCPRRPIRGLKAYMETFCTYLLSCLWVTAGGGPGCTVPGWLCAKKRREAGQKSRWKSSLECSTYLRVVELLRALHSTGLDIHLSSWLLQDWDTPDYKITVYSPHPQQDTSMLLLCSLFSGMCIWKLLYHCISLFGVFYLLCFVTIVFYWVWAALGIFLEERRHSNLFK